MLYLNSQFRRFILAGSFNTLNGYFWILSLQAITDQPFLSNSLGYAIAGILGYVIHARFTYKEQPKARSALLYAIVASICFIINLVLLSLCLKLLPPFLAQFTAITGFIIASYIGQSRFVFKKS